jgi:hypothetical protein
MNEDRVFAVTTSFFDLVREGTSHPVFLFCYYYYYYLMLASVLWSLRIANITVKTPQESVPKFPVVPDDCMFFVFFYSILFASFLIQVYVWFVSWWLKDKF